MMTHEQLRQSRANVSMWLIRSYYRELTGYYTDDPGVFSRKIVDGGKQLQTAHPAGWTEHIVNCTSPEALEFHRDELETIYEQLKKWGHDVSLPEQGVNDDE